MKNPTTSTINFQEFLNSLAEATSDGMSYEIPTEPSPDDDDWLDNDLEEGDEDEIVGDRSDAVSIHPFKPGHNLYKTHYIQCDYRLPLTCSSISPTPCVPEPCSVDVVVVQGSKESPLQYINILSGVHGASGGARVPKSKYRGRQKVFHDVQVQWRPKVLHGAVWAHFWVESLQIKLEHQFWSFSSLYAPFNPYYICLNVPE